MNMRKGRNRMIIINFSHPLTEVQLLQIRQIAGKDAVKVIDVKTQFDHSAPFSEQMKTALQCIPLNSKDWQTSEILINLPSLNVIAALLLAELHGLMGYFPTVIRIRPIQGSLPPSYEVAELLSLQAVRDAARLDR